VRAAVVGQRDMAVVEDASAAAAITSAGGEILELSAPERAAFLAAVAPLRDEARASYPREILDLLSGI
jgi:hypothetical protein